MFELEELDVEAEPGECWRFVADDVVGVAAVVVEVIFGSPFLASVSVTSFFSAGFEPSASVGGRTSFGPTSLFTIRLKNLKIYSGEKKINP